MAKRDRSKVPIIEGATIVAALAECNGIGIRAAQKLGISRQTICRWLKGSPDKPVKVYGAVRSESLTVLGKPEELRAARYTNPSRQDVVRSQEMIDAIRHMRGQDPLYESRNPRVHYAAIKQPAVGSDTEHDEILRFYPRGSFV